MDSVQSSVEISNDDTNYLSNADLLEMKNILDDELGSLLVAHSAVTQESGPADLEELQKRVRDLQEQLLEESNTCSVNELFLKRVQTGKTLCDAIFSDDTDAETNVYISRCLEELELTSEIKRIQKETSELEDKLLSQNLANLQLRKENTEMMQQIQRSKERSQSVPSEVAHNSNYKRLKSELEVKSMSVEIQKNLIQSLVMGMEQDWMQHPEFGQVMLDCGETLTL